MTLPTFADALAIEGGAFVPERAPEGVSPAMVQTCLATIHEASAGFDAVMTRAGGRAPAAIALTPTSSFRCSVRRVAEGASVIFVPLGAAARLHVLSRVLLRYWGAERRVRVFQSPLDEIRWEPRSVPERLRPLLLEYDDEAQFWKQLAALDASIEPSPADADALELTHLSVLYLLSHEFAHVLHGHFEFLERAERGEIELSADARRRGVEIDADDAAAAVSMLLLSHAVDGAQRRGEPVDVRLGWLRLGYAVTMLFGITDAQLRHFGAFDHGEYPHPTVRCEWFAEAALRSLSAPPEVKRDWMVNNTEGWKRCVQAFDDLTLDAMDGAFGEMPKDVLACAIHNLRYGISVGGPTDRALMQRLETARSDMRAVREHLPLFQRQREPH